MADSKGISQSIQLKYKTDDLEMQIIERVHS